MTQEELFTLKGKLTWEIQVAQARLNDVNQKLAEIVNAQAPAAPPKE